MACVSLLIKVAACFALSHRTWTCDCDNPKNALNRRILYEHQNLVIFRRLNLSKIFSR